MSRGHGHVARYVWRRIDGTTAGERLCATQNVGLAWLKCSPIMLIARPQAARGRRRRPTRKEERLRLIPG